MLLHLDRADLRVDYGVTAPAELRALEAGLRELRDAHTAARGRGARWARLSRALRAVGRAAGGVPLAASRAARGLPL